jgi:TPR repeat protein
LYGKGLGVPQDYAEAVTWYRKAAEQGYAVAQYALGVGYDRGQGVPQDDAEAVTWYRKAAEQGYADAQNNLGNIYNAGRGVPQDFVQAHKWYSLAAARSAASEVRLRNGAVKNRDRVAAKMTTAQIAEAQRLAREWKPK